MCAIFKRETKSYFTSMIGYVLIAVLLAFTGLYFGANNLIYGSPDFASTMNNTIIVLLFVLPALTMRSFADERRNKTDQLLLTSPVSIPGIVFGKYLAQMVIFCVPVLVACVMPIILGRFGKVSMVSAYSAILAYVLLGAACIAIGTYISALTENQILAYLGTFGALLVCYLMEGIKGLFTAGNTMALIVFAVLLAVIALIIGLACKSLTIGCGVFCGGAVILVILFKLRAAWLLTAFNAILSALALFRPFQNFVGGMFDATGIIYYLSVIVLFLFLTGQALEKRRWN